MELHIANLGRIKEANLDIRPLTVFIGPNHTNKTWTAYALYGIALNLARVAFSSQRNVGFVPGRDLQSAVESAAGRLLDVLTVAPASEVRAQVTRNEVVRDLAPSKLSFSLNEEGIGSILSLDTSTLNGAGVELAFKPEEFDRPVYSSLELTYKPHDLELECSFVRGDGTRQLHPYIVRRSLRGGREPNVEEADSKTVLRRALEQAIAILVYTLLDDAAVLPAERKALLSLNFLDLYHREWLDGTARPLPSVIYDFLYMINTARRLKDVPRARPEFPAFLAEILEKHIIQGIVEFEDDAQPQATRPGTSPIWRASPAAFGRGTITYSTGEGVKLPIHAAASMVRSFAALDIYLKEYCDRGGLLIIDEPEMNAHPEAQLKIIEFLALLAHHGVRVVLTTHSPYIVDHLSNLMQASRLSERAKEAIAPKFKLGNPHSFVSPEEVSAYLFTESGAVEDILDRKDGIIDLQTFSRPTDYMVNLVNGIWRAQDEDASQVAETVDAV